MVNRKYVRRLESQKDIEALKKLLKYPDATIRKYSVRALGNLKDVTVIFALINALGDAKFCVSFAAREALIENGESAVEPIIQALKDNKDCYTRWNLAEILGCIGCKKVTGSLIEALHDENRYVRTSAAWSLGRIGDVKAIQSLTELLNDEKPYVQKQSRKALKRILRGMISQVLATKSELTKDKKQELKDKVLELAEILKIEVQFPKTQENNKSQSQASDRKKGDKTCQTRS